MFIQDLSLCWWLGKISYVYLLLCAVIVLIELVNLSCVINPNVLHREIDTRIT